MAIQLFENDRIKPWNFLYKVYDSKSCDYKMLTFDGKLTDWYDNVNVYQLKNIKDNLEWIMEKHPSVQIYLMPWQNGFFSWYEKKDVIDASVATKSFDNANDLIKYLTNKYPHIPFRK